MNFNQLLMGNVVADQSVSSFITGKGQTGSKGSNNSISFNQILGNRMSNAKSTTAAVVSAGKAPEKEPEVSNTPLYKSYRQLRESMHKTDVKEPVYKNEGSTKDAKVMSEDNDTSQKPEENEAESSINVMQVLAQLLGVDQEKLSELMKENGIQPEKLNSLENTADTVKLLSEVLELDEGGTKTLEKLMDIIKETAAASQNTKEPVPQNPEELSNSRPQIQAASEEMTGQTDVSTQVQKTMPEAISSQLVAEISEKLGEYAQKLSADKDSVENEIEKLLAPMLKQTEAVKQSIPQLEQTAEAGTEIIDNSASQETKISEEPGLRQEETAEDNDKGDLQTKDEGKGQDVLLKPAQQSDKNIQPVFTAISADKTASAPIESIRTERQHVPASEIISQIVEKAGVVITHDKSEMVMELKPESLGRISLKVVTENGIVMAKLVAENKQVQQVLETNLQTLRESMERQGINVQSLSVSVRQDGRPADQNRSQYGNSQNAAERRGISGTRAIEGTIAGFADTATASNPYLREISTINLTA